MKTDLADCMTPNKPIQRTVQQRRCCPAADGQRVCQAWHRTSRVQVPMPGIGGAEG